jgi:hypothetical protein
VRHAELAAAGGSTRPADIRPTHEQERRRA